MYELLDAAGATLCDPLLIILLAVMMMPSGGSSYVFSGKTDDVGFLLLKARGGSHFLVNHRFASPATSVTPCGVTREGHTRTPTFPPQFN